MFSICTDTYNFSQFEYLFFVTETRFFATKIAGRYHLFSQRIECGGFFDRRSGAHMWDTHTRIGKSHQTLHPLPLLCSYFRFGYVSGSRRILAGQCLKQREYPLHILHGSFKIRLPGQPVCGGSFEYYPPPDRRRSRSGYRRDIARSRPYPC